MSAEIINLRKARKRRDREAESVRAEERRAKFGAAKKARKEAEAKAAKESRHLDGHWLGEAPADEAVPASATDCEPEDRK